MANGNNDDLKLSHLFIAGAVTAAGAAFFWWIKESIVKSRKAEDRDQELEHMILVSEASGAEEGWV